MQERVTDITSTTVSFSLTQDSNKVQTIYRCDVIQTGCGLRIERSGSNFLSPWRQTIQ